MPKGVPAVIARMLKERAKALERDIRAAEKKTAEEGLKVMRFYSSGLYTLQRLAQLGHPYATRRPRPPQDVALINYHKGRFYRGWRVLVPRKTAGGLVTTLRNRSPVARKLILGTSVMIARPITHKLQPVFTLQRLRNLSAALQKQRDFNL